MEGKHTDNVTLVLMLVMWMLMAVKEGMLLTMMMVLMVQIVAIKIIITAISVGASSPGMTTSMTMPRTTGTTFRFPHFQPLVTAASHCPLVLGQWEVLCLQTSIQSGQVADDA